MYIELRGVEFTNKGAELMLYAILDQVKKRFPEAEFVMEYRRNRSPITKHRELGIKTKFKFKRFRSFFKMITPLIPTPFLNSLNFVKERQIKHVLDGSGFAFGDKWGADKAGERLGDHIGKWKSEGKKIVLLPQAFGPFEQPDLKKQMHEILKYADLIYARDPISYDYLIQLRPDRKKIRLKPDFTNIIEGDKTEDVVNNDKNVAIIPNFKMIEATETRISREYPAFLHKAINQVQEQGYSPFFLMHSLDKDEEIAEAINDKLDKSIPIIKETDPLKVKGLIGNSKAVITSRFHGLASALSQAIPCLTTGWSHKYQMILKDYDYSEGMCNVVDADVEEKIIDILNSKTNQRIRAKLHHKALEQKKRSEEMWEEIFDILDK